VIVLSKPEGTLPPVRSLLLVDDDDLTRQLLGYLFSVAGWTTHEAASGEAALAALTAFRPSVILTDLQMPGLCGSPLAHALRSAAPQVRIVAMTATLQSAGTPEGFDALLLKPLTVDHLEAALQNKPAHIFPIAQAAEDLNPVTYAKFAAALPLPQLRAMYNFALADAETRIAGIRSAIALEDETILRTQAHALKGSAGMIGANAMQSFASLLETQDFCTSDATAILQQIIESIARLRSILATRM
jgi:CheY-like chemotaxis protein